MWKEAEYGVTCFVYPTSWHSLLCLSVAALHSWWWPHMGQRYDRELGAPSPTVAEASHSLWWHLHSIFAFIGKAPPNLPQGVPPLLHNQYLVGPGGLLPAYPVSVWSYRSWLPAPVALGGHTWQVRWALGCCSFPGISPSSGLHQGVFPQQVI